MSSNHMEKEGLSRALQFLINQHHLNIATLITDRHKQVSKFLCNKYPEIEHQYDIWHISKGTLVIKIIVLFFPYVHHNKGLKKKLLKLSKYKDCELIAEWMKSIINHLYWCAASANGDHEQIIIRWKSLISHLANDHSDCYHSDLGDRQKKWFIPGMYACIMNYTYVYIHNLHIIVITSIIGSKAFKQLSNVVSSKHLLADIKKLSPSK